MTFMMKAWQHWDGCPTTSWQLPDEFCDGGLTTLWYLSKNFRTTTWWLPDNCRQLPDNFCDDGLTTLWQAVWWLLENFLATSRQLPKKMTAWWQPNDCLTNAWHFPDNCLMTLVLKAQQLCDSCLTTSWQLPDNYRDDGKHDFLEIFWQLPYNCLKRQL